MIWLRHIKTLLEMIRFSHSIFALPFALLATFLAGRGGQPGFCGWGKLALIVWCMVWARSAAMTFNRIVDARLDVRNPRTAGRAIPAGMITLRQAWLCWGICAALFIAGAYAFWRPILGVGGYGNVVPIVLVVPVLAFICLYSYTKRFTWMAHFWLGASLMLAPVSAWMAVSPPAGPVVSVEVLVLGVAVLFWTAGFDIIYACQDIEVDRRDGLYSVPARLGVNNAMWISRTCHLITIGAFFLLGHLTDLGYIYFNVLGVVAVLILAEHLLVAGGRMQHVKIAFATINGLISILLCTAAIADIMLLYPVG